ncbi:MAG: TrkH family potassium uptake protein [Clostridia bacterium]|nr:TrkH family potassium uptake protein [Clostridia bacterium]
MNYSIIRYITGWVVFTISLFMLLPAVVSLIYKEINTATILLMCALVFGLIGYLIKLKKPSDRRFFAREGFIVATLSWIIISLIAALPFWLSGEIPSYIDALFEVVSGFTTTGSTILTDIEALSKGLSFWRCFTIWIGGMGVLVFILAIMPQASGQAVYILKAESTGPSVGKLVPKLKESASILYLIYLSLTVVQVILLLVADVPVFDSFCIAFSTAGTGGFAPLNTSIASYSTAAINIISVFMLLFGVNFNIYFLILAKRFKEAFANEELRWYLIIYFAATAIVGTSLFISAREYFNLTDIFFQTSSIMTSTGFSTVDFNLWPSLSQAILVMVMFVGACAGSTGGGIKVYRFVVYAKTVKKQLSSLIHPRSVKVLKMDSKPINHETIRIINVYFATYMLVFVASLLIILIDGFDLVTSFTAVAATLNNVGPGLGEVGPMYNFSQFSALSKIVFSLDMLAGRLEIFPLLIFFSPSAWNRK